MKEIIIYLIEALLSALATFLVARITMWLNSKIKDENAKKLATSALEVITTVVKATYQTYVQTLKDTGAFNEEAQKKALFLAKEKALSTFTDETKTYITETYGDIEKWVETQIESVLYNLKN